MCVIPLHINCSIISLSKWKSSSWRQKARGNRKNNERERKNTALIKFIRKKKEESSESEYKQKAIEVNEKDTHTWCRVKAAAAASRAIREDMRRSDENAVWMMKNRMGRWTAESMKLNCTSRVPNKFLSQSSLISFFGLNLYSCCCYWWCLLSSLCHVLYHTQLLHHFFVTCCFIIRNLYVYLFVK